MISGLSNLSAVSGAGGGSITESVGGGASNLVSGKSFAEMVERTAGSFVDTLRGAETAATRALQGDGDIRSVVDQVMSAEQSLQAAVAVRDKIVAAYLEVSRMSI